MTDHDARIASLERQVGDVTFACQCLITALDAERGIGNAGTTREDRVAQFRRMAANALGKAEHERERMAGGAAMTDTKRRSPLRITGIVVYAYAEGAREAIDDIEQALDHLPEDYDYSTGHARWAPMDLPEPAITIARESPVAEGKDRTFVRD